MDSPNNQEAGLLFEFLKFGPQEFFFFFFFFKIVASTQIKLTIQYDILPDF